MASMQQRLAFAAAPHAAGVTWQSKEQRLLAHALDPHSHQQQVQQQQAGWGGRARGWSAAGAPGARVSREGDRPTPFPFHPKLNLNPLSLPLPPLAHSLAPKHFVAGSKVLEGKGEGMGGPAAAPPSSTEGKEGWGRGRAPMGSSKAARGEQEGKWGGALAGAVPPTALGAHPARRQGLGKGEDRQPHPSHPAFPHLGRHPKEAEDRAGELPSFAAHPHHARNEHVPQYMPPPPPQPLGAGNSAAADPVQQLPFELRVLELCLYEVC